MSPLRIPYRKLLFIPPVVIGVLAVMYLASHRPSAGRVEATERVTLARAIVLERVNLVPRVLGYGNAEAGDVWRGVAQVGGRIIEVHPRLEPGEIFPAGMVMLRIDPTDYELAIAQIQAQLAELDATEVNTQASLAIERRSLELSRENLEDNRQLLAEGVLSQVEFDAEERSTLVQEIAVQSLENALNLIPSQRARLNAQLEQARLDLSRTEIAPPFDIRIMSSDVEEGQYVSVGTTMVEGDSIARSEVAAQVSMSHMRTLIAASGMEEIPIGSDQLPDLSQLNLSALIRMESGDFRVEWDGRVDRFSPQIDLQTRTIGVITAVDDTYINAVPGERPPLVRGAHCEVEIRGPAMPGVLVVPRSALHSGQVYLIDEESRLRMRPVEVAFTQSNLAVISEGLAEGDTLVVSDLIPAIEGMLIEPTLDTALADALRAEATGAAPVR